MDEQIKNKLKALTEKIEFDKITASFSIEGPRKETGKRTVFCSASTSNGKSFSWEESRVVSLAVAKRVVGMTYDNAVKTKAISSQTQEAELPEILRAFDATIEGLLGGK